MATKPHQCRDGLPFHQTIGVVVGRKAYGDPKGLPGERGTIFIPAYEDNLIKPHQWKTTKLR